jgi:hypothetical protein
LQEGQTVRTGMIEREIDCDSQVIVLTIFNFGSGFVFVTPSDVEIIGFFHDGLLGAG